MCPENKTRLIEQGTTLLSDGYSFECSIEPSEDRFGKGLYLTGNYYGTKDSFKEFLSNLIIDLDKSHIIYNIDYEIKEGDGYVELNTHHPDFGKKYIPSNSVKSF
jgi:hypothetical protein